MSSNQDITTEKLSATRGANCRTESENQPAHARACENQFGPIEPDMLHHHNERGKKERTSAGQKTEPEPDYDEEGMPPHN